MKTRAKDWALAAAWAVSLSLFSCQGDDEAQVTSETHFLTQCRKDAACEAGLICVCGACTAECSEDSRCDELIVDAVCTAREARPLAQSCVDTEVTATCEVPCEEVTDCMALGEDFGCDRGLCRRSDPACPSEPIEGSNFALLGDLFLADSGEVTRYLEDYLLLAGVLEAGENLRDHSSGAITALGGSADLPSQYQEAISEGPLRVAILDAGGPDVLLDCDTGAAELCSSLQTAANGLQSLLSTMAADGVTDVVLFYYPRPDDADLAEKFNLLEPELESICEGSDLGCHFLPLAPHFESRRDELLTGMGLLPTTAGAEVTAGLLYGELQSACLVP